MIVKLDEVHFKYPGWTLFESISFSIERGEHFCIMGPNGCGKTTLLKLINRIHKPDKGTITVKGRPLTHYTRKELARIMAVVPQEHPVDFPFTAFEVVLMGRMPYLRRFQYESRKDREIAMGAMEMTDTTHLAPLRITEISTGEKQRVVIARALTQEPEILLLDEFTSSLDLQHQMTLYNLLSRLQSEKGITIVNISHDMNMASLFGDRILMLREGKIKSLGKPVEVINEKNLEEVFQVRMRIEHDPETCVPFIKPTRNV